MSRQVFSFLSLIIVWVTYTHSQLTTLLRDCQVGAGVPLSWWEHPKIFDSRGKSGQKKFKGLPEKNSSYHRSEFLSLQRNPLDWPTGVISAIHKN